MCKSNAFPLRRLRSKEVGVASETGIAGVSSTICLRQVTFIDILTATSDGSRELIRIDSHYRRIFLFSFDTVMLVSKKNFILPLYIVNLTKIVRYEAQ